MSGFLPMKLFTNLFKPRGRPGFTLPIRPPLNKPQKRRLSSRVFALAVIVLVVPIFLVIALAVILFSGWPIVLSEKFRTRDGSVLVRLVFNTRSCQDWARLNRRRERTTQERLSRFLRSTRLAELPCLLQFAFGKSDVDLSIPVPRSYVSWQSLSSWANVASLPQMRYGDLLMAKFNDACDNGNTALALQICEEIETELAGPLRTDLDEPRKLLNDYSLGVRRLVLMDQRLWHLRHPEKFVGHQGCAGSHADERATIQAATGGGRALRTGTDRSD